MTSKNVGATRIHTDDGQEWRVSETALDLAAQGGSWVLATNPGSAGSIVVPVARIVAIVDEPEDS